MIKVGIVPAQNSSFFDFVEYCCVSWGFLEDRFIRTSLHFAYLVTGSIHKYQRYGKLKNAQLQQCRHFEVRQAFTEHMNILEILEAKDEQPRIRNWTEYLGHTL